MSSRRRNQRHAPRSRSETKQATRARLVEAAIEQFAAHGFDVSLDAICASADLTRGAFYVHFADREALIAAAMHEVLGGFVTALTGTTGATVADAARLFFTAVAEGSPLVHGARGLRFFQLLEACHRSEALGETYRGLLLAARDRLAQMIAGDQAGGRIRRDVAPTALADLLLVVGLGLVTRNDLALPLDVSALATASLAVLAPAP